MGSSDGSADELELVLDEGTELGSLGGFSKGYIDVKLDDQLIGVLLV